MNENANKFKPYTASLRWFSEGPSSDETGSLDVPDGMLVILIAHVTPADDIAVSYYEIDVHEGDMCYLLRGDLPVGNINDADDFDEDEATLYTVYPSNPIPFADALRFAEHHAQSGNWADTETVSEGLGETSRNESLTAVFTVVKQYMALHFAAQLLDAHVTLEVTDSTAENLADFLREMEKGERARAAKMEVDANLNLSGTHIAQMEAQAHKELGDPEEDTEDDEK